MTSSTGPNPPASGIVMTPGYARTIAQLAYVWGWPMVNMLNRRASITKAPQPSLLNGVLPVAPRAAWPCLRITSNPVKRS